MHQNSLALHSLTSLTSPNQSPCDIQSPAYQQQSSFFTWDVGSPVGTTPNYGFGESVQYISSPACMMSPTFTFDKTSPLPRSPFMMIQDESFSSPLATSTPAMSAKNDEPGFRLGPVPSRSCRSQAVIIGESLLRNQGSPQPMSFSNIALPFLEDTMLRGSLSLSESFDDYFEPIDNSSGYGSVLDMSPEVDVNPFLRGKGTRSTNTRTLPKPRRRSHACNYCPKTFTQRSTLKAHIRIHTGEKPYQCSYCSKTFTDYSTWRKHVRLHTGEKPYVCDICDKGFVQSGNMIRHRETHFKTPKKATGV